MRPMAFQRVDKEEAWEFFPWVLVRFATTPRSALARTRLVDTLRVVKRASAIRRELSASAETLSAAIYTVVPNLEACARGKALAARRAIFRLDAIACTDWLADSAKFDASLPKRLDEWMARRKELIANEAELRRVYDREVQQNDEILWRLVESSCFQRGLSVANPLLAEHVPTLVRKPHEQLSSRERLLRMRTVRYLHRAALRPTPFGFFAAIAIARLGPSDSEASVDISRLVESTHAVSNCEQQTDVPALQEQRSSNIYLDPGSFEQDGHVWAISPATGESSRVEVEEAANFFGEIACCPTQSMPWERARTKLGDEVLARLTLAGMVVSDFCNPNEGSRFSVDASQAKRLYADALHPSVIPLHRDMFTGFTNEVLHYGAATFYPGSLPEQRGLACIFIELYGAKNDVPLLTFFRDFMAARRARGLDHLDINTAACMLGKQSDSELRQAAAPLEKVIRCALSASSTAETKLELDLSHFALWEGDSTRLTMLLVPGSEGLSGKRFCIRLWGAARMSLFPRYASSIAAAAPGWVEDYRHFMQLWPDTADLWGGNETGVERRPPLTSRTINVPGSPPRESGIALRDLRIHLDSSAGRLTVIEAGVPVNPVFFGVTIVPSRPPLYQFLEILGNHRMSVFELLLHSLARTLSEDAIWKQCGSVGRVPSVCLGNYIVLSPVIARIEAAALPNFDSCSRYLRFVKFHDWWQDHGLPLVSEVHVPRGTIRIDLGSPDGVQSFYAHVRDAERIHVISPFALDNSGLKDDDGESHEVEFALEIAARDRHVDESNCYSTTD